MGIGATEVPEKIMKETSCDFFLSFGTEDKPSKAMVE
jgi:hypothetical protein